MPLCGGWSVDDVDDVGDVPEAFLEIGIVCAESLGATGGNQ